MGLHDDIRNKSLPNIVNTDDNDFCDLQSHSLCNPRHCDVQSIGEKLQSITEGQIKIAITTAIAGLLVSTIFALALIAVWAWHAAHGNPMPDVPWYVISIAMVPFGSSMVMRIPKKTQYRIGAVND
jgi:hypothetical protein